jgi:hypothetical protein
MGGNMMPGGCSSTGINEAVRLFNLASTKCPNTIITAGGYSQGTACIHRSIPKLTLQVQQKIGKIILFTIPEILADSFQLVSSFSEILRLLKLVGRFRGWMQAVLKSTATPVTLSVLAL